MEEEMGFFSRKAKYPLFGDDFEKDEFDGGYADDGDDYYDDEPVDQADEVATPAEPVAPAAPAFSAAPVALKIITPKAAEDAREITEYLMNGNTILLNMDGIEREPAVHIIDHLKGAVQVLGGVMKKVGKTTLVIAPKNVDVSSIEAIVGGSAE